MKTTFHKKTIPKIWAVAILRDDYKYTFERIGLQMQMSGGRCCALYQKFNEIKKHKIL